MAKIPAEQYVQVNFRMPESLRDRVRESAEVNGRSVTSELIFLLERALGPDDLEIAHMRQDFLREFTEFVAQRKQSKKE